MKERYQNYDIIYEMDEESEEIVPTKVYNTNRIDILRDNSTFFMRQIAGDHGINLHFY